MVVERYLGLAHPQRPFAVSANTMVLENADDLAQVHGIAEQMGHDFTKSAVLSVPLSFPPALSDCDDRTLQKAMCCAALDSNRFVGAAVVDNEAVEAFAEELLGESVMDLGSFEDEDMATLLDANKSRARHRKTIHSKEEQNKTAQRKAMQSKAKPGEAKQCKPKHSHAKQSSQKRRRSKENQLVRWNMEKDKNAK